MTEAGKPKSPLWQILRVAWVLMALAFAAYFVVTRWGVATSLLAQLSWWQVGLSIALLCAGKLTYVEVVRRTVSAGGGPRSFSFAFYAYNISQLGKYIPGSVWQFLGRFDIYKKAGIKTQTAVKLILLENGIMLTVAAVLSLFAAPALVRIVPQGANLGAIGAVLTLIAAVGLLVIWRSATLLQKLRDVLSEGWRRKALVAVLVLLFVIMWVLLGWSVLCLVAAETTTVATSLFVIGLFALAYIAGFLAIFAPAGVGVREFVFTIGLAGLMSPEAALMVALGHRLLYVLADVTLGGLAWLGERQLAGADMTGPRPSDVASEP